MRFCQRPFAALFIILGTACGSPSAHTPAHTQHLESRFLNEHFYLWAVPQMRGAGEFSYCLYSVEHPSGEVEVVSPGGPLSPVEISQGLRRSSLVEGVMDTLLNVVSGAGVASVFGVNLGFVMFFGLLGFSQNMPKDILGRVYLTNTLLDPTKSVTLPADVYTRAVDNLKRLVPRVPGDCSPLEVTGEAPPIGPYSQNLSGIPSTTIAPP